jgi:lysophospholipase L1-like esterase
LKLDIPKSLSETVELRLRFSNAFGSTPLVITEVSVARPFNNSAGTSVIDDDTVQKVTFNSGSDMGVNIPDGAQAVSDSFMFDISGLRTYQSNGTTEAGTIIAVTVYLEEGQSGEAITSHPGSRVSTFLGHGNQTIAGNITGSDVQVLEHWYFSSAVEVRAPKTASTFILVGDSITDGRGSGTNENNRWPDYLFTRLQAQSSTQDIVIANQAAGGNRVLLDGLGPSALSRIDRDVLAQSGVGYVLVFEGVNDIGTAGADEIDQTALYHDLIAAYRQIIARVHAQDLPCLGATITPFGNPNTTLQPYSNSRRELTRQAVNVWIRNGGEFDAVVDFDLTVRDASNSTMLAPQYDSGDGLHPNTMGYQAMADNFPLDIFT